jgi:hypothetical protein
MNEFEKTPFLSLRNVPFWGGVAFVVVVIGLIMWLQ